MNAKEYLSRYHETEIKINKLQQMVDEYIRLANSIPGINFDAIRVDGTKNLQAPFEKWILRALNDEAVIIELKLILPTIKGEIIAVIDELEDKELRKLLIYRYLDWSSWQEIADKMFVSISTIKRWHKTALELLKIQKLV
jgi:DNA-directed RNA polymerase specialized sigma24 family protein